MEIIRDKSKMLTINSKVTSICNKQHPADVKSVKHYHAFKEKKENIFDVIASFLKLGQGVASTKPSNNKNN